MAYDDEEGGSDCPEEILLQKHRSLGAVVVGLLQPSPSPGHASLILELDDPCSTHSVVGSLISHCVLKLIETVVVCGSILRDFDLLLSVSAGCAETR